MAPDIKTVYVRQNVINYLWEWADSMGNPADSNSCIWAVHDLQSVNYDEVYEKTNELYQEGKITSQTAFDALIGIHNLDSKKADSYDVEAMEMIANVLDVKVKRFTP